MKVKGKKLRGNKNLVVIELESSVMSWHS